MKEYTVPGEKKFQKSHDFLVPAFLIHFVPFGYAIWALFSKHWVLGITTVILTLISVFLTISYAGVTLEAFSDLKSDHLDLYNEACKFEEERDWLLLFKSFFLPPQSEVNVALKESAMLVWRAHLAKVAFFRRGIAGSLEPKDPQNIGRSLEAQHRGTLNKIEQEITAAEKAFQRLAQCVDQQGYEVKPWKHYVGLDGAKAVK